MGRENQYVKLWDVIRMVDDKILHLKIDPRCTEKGGGLDSYWADDEAGNTYQVLIGADFIEVIMLQ
jgi:hypothetical protein